MGKKANDKREVSFEGTMQLETVLGYLEEFVGSMRAGTVRVESGEDEVVLAPADSVKLEVKAKSKKGKQSFRLELSWEERKLEIGS